MVNASVYGVISFFFINAFIVSIKMYMEDYIALPFCKYLFYIFYLQF